MKVSAINNFCINNLVQDLDLNIYVKVLLQRLRIISYAFSFFHQKEVIRPSLLMANVRQHRELFIRTISLQDNAALFLVDPSF